MPLAASGRSVIDSLRECDLLELCVASVGLTQEVQVKLLDSWADARVSILFLELDERRLIDFPPVSHQLSTHYTAAVYGALVLPDILPEEWDRVIYLDCDTITRSSLSELWETPLNGRILGAVVDSYVPTVGSPYGVSCWREIGMGRDFPYFNSGVLLIDLIAWRRERITYLCHTFVRTHGDSFNQHDQGILNAVIAERWLALSLSWNVSSYWRLEERRVGAQSQIIDEAKIRHFAGDLKPWTTEGHLELEDSYSFFDSLDRTEWKRWRPMEPAL